MVLGDRDELIRALENLVENALKYGAAGNGSISRSGYCAGTSAALALVKHVLNRLGGRPTMESTLGQGASFSTAVTHRRNPPLWTKGG